MTNDTMRYVALATPTPKPKLVVRACDELDGTRTWDVVEVTVGEREQARREGRTPGVPVAQAFRTRAEARRYRDREAGRGR